MRSPFAIFRKHQKMAMVILTGLSMFAFVVMDQLRAESPMTVPILAAAAGMLLFGFLGYRRGEPVTWGVAGTALGVALAVVAMRFAPSGPKPPVQTALGDISHEELNKLMMRRNNANNFLRMAFEKVNPPRSNNPMFLQYYEQQLRGVLFDFGMNRGDDMSDDVVMGFLLDKEADDMGLSVSDGTVTDYIHKVTDNKLSQTEYSEILKTLRLSDGQLYDAIRAELRARLAMEMLLPRANPTPEQYWDDYRKLQVTQTLDVAAIPVADFVAQAPQPTDEDIRKYYNTWKGLPPMAPGAPGLLQPRRARIEFLQADYAEIEKQVAAKPVTDAEVKAYYEEHKQDYRNRPAAGSSALSPLMQTPNSLSDPGLTVPATPALPTLPALPEPLVPKSPPAKQPTAPDMPASAGSPAPTPKAPAPTPPKASESKSTPAPKKTDSSSKSGASNDRPRGLGLDGEMLALADEPSGRTVQVAYQPTPAQKDPKAEQKKDTDQKKPASGAPATHPTASSHQTSEPKAPALPRTASGKGEPLPEFRPLDDLLQREIRDLILRNRTLEVMKSRTQGAYDYMAKLREQVIPAEIGGEPAMNSEQRSKALADYAAHHGLTYGITPLLSFIELRDATEKYPIAAAAEPVENPFQNREPISVLQVVFGSPLDALFQPAQADDRDTHRFAFWKVEDVDSHIPSLEEPGVRDAAIRGWKIETYAQKQAETRAKELADLVRKANKPMAEALVGQTVTKQPKSLAVLVVPAPPFSWYTVSSTAPEGLMPQTTPKLSEVVGVKEAGDAFMKTVFDEMKVGDVKAIPNMGGSVFYVVKVKTRHPENAEELAAFRARFMKENFFGSFFGHSTYEYLNAGAEQELLRSWTDRLFVKYNVKRNADEEPVRQTRSRRRTG
ncbi:MAG TPA: SurA N-terminal domain-containing protein [Planctomycetaceae bacterium]|nr:SurA N-terminal domain-containing protein [Planctomycetaceae bacterium]